MDEPITRSSGKISHVAPMVTRSISELEIATDRGSFPVRLGPIMPPPVGAAVEVEWISGLPRRVTWQGLVIWSERFCGNCGHSNVEHDPGACEDAALQAHIDRIAKYGECPVCDLGIDFASCICPPIDRPAPVDAR